MSYPTAIETLYGDTSYSIFTIDIRDDSTASFKSDYLKTDIPTKPQIIITNPPFNIALDIVKKALNDVAEGGYVIMLLRLNFLETKARKTFFDEYMPKYIFVHGSTDSVAYCHMVWQKGHHPEFSKIKVI